MARLRRALAADPDDRRVSSALVRLLAEAAQRNAREGRWEGSAAHLREIAELDSSWLTKSPAIARATATVLLLGGWRHQAIGVWSSLPVDGDFWQAHFLWLAHYWEGRRNPKNSDIWQAAIGYLVVLLHDPGLQDWFDRRAARFGRASIDETVRTAVRERLEHQLFVPESAAPALHWELQGARALQELGGLPLDKEPGRTLVCGPWMLGHLRLTPHLQDWAAGLPGSSERVRAIRRLFSELGMAQVLLNRNLPAQAFTALQATAEIPLDLQSEARALKLEIVQANVEQLRARSLDDAIAFLDNRPAFGDIWNDLLGKLASLYHERGVQRANAKAPNWIESLRDLRRSVKLNPYFPARVCDLLRALRLRTREVAPGDPGWGLRLLVEAREEAEKALKEFSAEEEIAQEIQRIREEIEQIRKWRSQGGGE
jgi:hypothetical protein